MSLIIYSLSVLVLIVVGAQNFSNFDSLSSASEQRIKNSSLKHLDNEYCAKRENTSVCSSISVDQISDNASSNSDAVRNQTDDYYYYYETEEHREDADEDESISVERKVNDGYWYENVPSPPIVVASSKTLLDNACKRQLTMYLQELRNGTLWAMQMFDASAKQPYGVIDGQTRHLGSFDQCYRLNTKLSKNGERIKGRYCLVDYKYERTDKASGFKGNLDIDFDPNESAWESIREKGDFRRIKRYMFQMALCVPAACSPADIEAALHGPFDEFAERNNLIVNVEVDEKNCQTSDEELEFTTGTCVLCTVLASIVILVTISTLYDGTLNSEEEEKRVATSRSIQILLCFSARRNLRTIFDVSYKHRGLDTIHFFRFFFILCVILGHRIMQYYLNPIVNGRYLEGTFKIPTMVLIHNGTIIVDGFFAIGGLLTCYGLLIQFDKSRRMNFIGLAILRFSRFTPAYALLIFFNAYLFPLMGSGPQWKSHVVTESENCAAVWWANLFYLNNYLTMDRLCIFQSWYLSVDFHCYLVAIFMIYAFWKLPKKIGYVMLGLATVISILIPFYTTYMHHLQPLFIGFPYIQTLATEPYFLNYYVKSHYRMTAYFVGVICGAILYDYEKAPTWRLSKNVSQALAPLAFALGIYSQRFAYEFFDPNNQPSILVTALYATLHRATFATATCLVVLLITMGDGLDTYYNFMTPGWLQPLSRLTYSVFIAHNIIQKYHIGSVRAARTFSANNVFWDFIPDVIFSFSLALLVAICIEGPFRKLEKHFLFKKTVKKSIRTSNESTNADRISELPVAKEID